MEGLTDTGNNHPRPRSFTRAFIRSAPTAGVLADRDTRVQALDSRLCSTSSVVIVQLPEVVAAKLRSSTGGADTRAGESNPPFGATQVLWKQPFTVGYTVHAVHCGTQVTASIGCLGGGGLNPLAAVALRTLSRRISSLLLAMRDDLE